MGVWEKERLRVPRGPATVTVRPSRVNLTPSGMLTFSIGRDDFHETKQMDGCAEGERSVGAQMIVL